MAHWSLIQNLFWKLAISCNFCMLYYLIIVYAEIMSFGLHYVWAKILRVLRGQLNSKANCQAKDSPKKRTNEFVFTSMRRVFVRFLGESSAKKKTFRDYLTFNTAASKPKILSVICILNTTYISLLLLHT